MSGFTTGDCRGATNTGPTVYYTLKLGDNNWLDLRAKMRKAK